MSKIFDLKTVLVVIFSVFSFMSLYAQRVNSPFFLSTKIAGNKIEIKTKGQKEKLRIMHITDAHITIPSAEDSLVWNYCKRMHLAYENTSSHISGENISRKESFSMLLDIAKRKNVDLIALTGDIINYPSSSAVKFVRNELQKTNIPFLYVAGNHDWHLEGKKGKITDLRKQGIKKLLPLYQDKKPLFNATIIRGINVVCIDNSTYQIGREQLIFFKNELKKGFPIVLMMHIPVYATLQDVGTMGHPSWGFAADKNYKLERREPWSKEGNSKETIEFRELLLKTPGVIILSGHVHTGCIENKSHLFQIVTGLSRDGAYGILDFVLDK